MQSLIKTSMDYFVMANEQFIGLMNRANFFPEQHFTRVISDQYLSELKHGKDRWQLYLAIITFWNAIKQSSMQQSLDKEQVGQALKALEQEAIIIYQNFQPIQPGFNQKYFRQLVDYTDMMAAQVQRKLVPTNAMEKMMFDALADFWNVFYKLPPAEDGDLKALASEWLVLEESIYLALEHQSNAA